MQDVQFITGRHRSTIYRWVQEGLFPKHCARGGKKIGWRKSDVHAWIQGLKDSD